MSLIKPNNFPVKPVLIGNEELYTQTSTENKKFSLEVLADYILDEADVWLYKEVVFGAEELGGLARNYIQILDEADLASGEYYEVRNINIINYYDISNYIIGADVNISFIKDFTEYLFWTIPQTFIESFRVSIINNYTPTDHEPYERGSGLYITSTKSVVGGTHDFKLGIYYKINS